MLVFGGPDFLAAGAGADMMKKKDYILFVIL
jgi:hypothetical protein